MVIKDRADEGPRSLHILRRHSRLDGPRVNPGILIIFGHKMLLSSRLALHQLERNSDTLRSELLPSVGTTAPRLAMLKAALASRWSFAPQVKQLNCLPSGRWMLP